MDMVVDFLSVVGPNGEIVVTQLSVVAAGVLQTYHLDLPKLPCVSFPERGGDAGHISYSVLPAILWDAVAGNLHHYPYGRTQCDFLSALAGRTFVDLTEFQCPGSHE
jgi:hypothetical protein